MAIDNVRKIVGTEANIERAFAAAGAGLAMCARLIWRRCSLIAYIVDYQDARLALAAAFNAARAAGAFLTELDGVKSTSYV